MMRGLLLATAAAVATPAAAQDHSAHAGHAAAQDHPAQAEQSPAAPPAGHSAHDRHTAPDNSESAPHGNDGSASAPSDPGEMDHDSMDHAAMDHGSMDHADPGAAGAADGHQGHEPAAPSAAPPSRAFEGPRYAADTIFDPAAMARARTETEGMDRMSFGTVMLERFEARIGESEDLYLWDAQARYGSDFDKLWLKSEGEGIFGGDVERAEVQALWGRAIGPFFDLQAGVRYDFEPGGRAHAVLGVQGLAPYVFEVDAAAFLSDEGDLTGRIEAEYDQRINQRLILQPRAEVSLAAQDIPEIGVGAGISSIEAGLRLRYEFLREFAPYVGIGYEARLGDTADYARAAGDDPDRVSLLLGLRAWF